MTIPAVEFALPDAGATARLGAALAHAIVTRTAAVVDAGFVVALAGDLGAGKTSIVRAMLRALGVTGAVRSPTFTLVEPYVVSSLNFYHFDFYRLTNAGEFASAGLREMLGPGAVCLIEWPDRVAGHLPAADLRIALTVVDEGRHARVTAATELGAACLQNIAKKMASPPA